MGQLSKNDRRTLFTVKEFGMDLVTNDKHLRTACLDFKIKVIWGLQLLIELVKKSDYSVNVAKNLGQKIYEKNDYISEEIVNDFISKIENIRNC